MTLEKSIFTKPTPALPRILVIDDDFETTVLLKTILSSNDFDVMVSNSGIEGIELARDWQPELILLDILMPDMDGFQVCKTIRRFSNIPILVVSAVGKAGIVEKALEVGADNFLPKPVKSNLLLVHINQLVRRLRAENGEKVLNQMFQV